MIWDAEFCFGLSGLRQQEASRRVNDVIANLASARKEAKEALESARETAMKVALYTFLSMLIGAFIASAFAALGGKHRDADDRVRQ